VKIYLKCYDKYIYYLETLIEIFYVKKLLY